MVEYPRTLVDMTHAPYQPVADRIVAAIGFAAAYEDVGLQGDNGADEQVTEYWCSLSVENRDRSNEDVIIDRITDILADHGYSLDVTEDYPGLWVIDREEN